MSIYQKADALLLINGCSIDSKQHAHRMDNEKNVKRMNKEARCGRKPGHACILNSCTQTGEPTAQNER
jgi:hypothetical protein